MITSLDAFKEWLRVNRARLFRGLDVVETDRLIRVKTKLGLLVDLVFSEYDICLTVSEDVGELEQLEFSSLKHYAKYNEHTRLARELEYWLVLDESGYVYYKEVGLDEALKSYLANRSKVIVVMEDDLKKGKLEMNILNMFKRWITVEKGLELVEEVFYTSQDCYTAKVLNEVGFLIKILIDEGIGRISVFVECGNSLERVYILTEDTSLDEYKHFIDVVTIWLEMDEFDYKTLLSNSESGKIPMLLGNLDSENLKEVEGDEFMSMLNRVASKFNGEVVNKPTECELEDLPPDEVVSRLKEIGFNVDGVTNSNDGVVKLTISYKPNNG